CASISAETIKTFKIEKDGIPGQTEPELIGLGLSRNGNYICGSITSGMGFFIADCITGDVKYHVTEYDDGAELRHVDNNGLAIGYEEDGIVYSFDTGEFTPLVAPEGIKYILGEDLTGNGSMYVGSFAGGAYSTQAVYSKDKVNWVTLPMPTEEQLGNYKGRVRNESAAKFVSDDGKVILGNIGGFAVPVLWVMNDNGEYEVDFFPARLVKLTEEDIADDSKMLYAISGMYTSLSSNGRYVVMIGIASEEGLNQALGVPIVYDTTTKEIKIYDEAQEIDELGIGLYPGAIADDGTFIGTVGMPFYASTGAFIMKKGETQAESYLTAFPEFFEKLGECDVNGSNVVIGISADATKMAGYVFYSEDFYDDSPAYYLTYLIDTSSDNAVNEIPTLKNASSIYSIDGTSLRSLAKGINIVRNADGTVSKILKR
ncbi:MAG: hypothetical protein K2O47_00515, partial [Muribaculaceae bacterium]|nr:hypothetical protein [Muribaculaceae bacterium]